MNGKQIKRQTDVADISVHFTLYEGLALPTVSLAVISHEENYSLTPALLRNHEMYGCGDSRECKGITNGRTNGVLNLLSFPSLSVSSLVLRSPNGEEEEQTISPPFSPGEKEERMVSSLSPSFRFPLFCARQLERRRSGRWGRQTKLMTRPRFLPRVTLLFATLKTRRDKNARCDCE